MKSKREILSDLRFCKALMDRLVEYADKNYCDTNSWSNYSVIQNDIKRLRRELMLVSHKLD